MINWLDATILIIVGSFALVSLFRGFLRELVVFVGVLASVYLATQLYAPLGRLLPFYRQNPGVAHAAAFASILLLGWTIANLLGFSLRRFARRVRLDWADALGGMAFGLLKGAFLISIILLFLLQFGDARIAAVIQKSHISTLIIAQLRRFWDPFNP